MPELPCQVTAQALRIGANRVSGCATYSFGSHGWIRGAAAPNSVATSSTGGLVAFGAGSFVALYDPGSAAILGLLSGHSGRVNCVEWVRRPRFTGGVGYDDEDELLSASSDGTVRAWRIRHDVAFLELRGSVDWTCTAILPGHKLSVTAVAACPLPSGVVVAVSSSVDGSLRAWSREQEHSKPPDSVWDARVSTALELKSGCIIETVAISCMPGGSAAAAISGVADTALVAAGGVDSRIHLFSLTASGGASRTPTLTELLVLRGHLDWIRCLAFSHHAELAAWAPADSTRGGDGNTTARVVDGSLYLASASQDRKVRVWRIRSLRRTPLASQSDGTGSSELSRDDDIASSIIVGDIAASIDENDDERDVDEEAEGGSGGGIESALQRPSVFTYTARQRHDGRAGPLQSVSSVACQVEFDALLSGHEGWVNSVRWHPPALLIIPAVVALLAAPATAVDGSAPVLPESRRWWQPPRLVSCSMDRNVIVWQPAGLSALAASTSAATPAAAAAAEAVAVDELLQRCWSGVWEPACRLGSGEGGSALGLYGAIVSPDGSVVVAHGYQGALHTWVGSSPSSVSISAEHVVSGTSLASPGDFNAHFRKCTWRAVTAPSGHFGGVNGLAWGSRGAYLLSFSSDATTRAWAPVEWAWRSRTSGSSISSSGVGASVRLVDAATTTHPTEDAAAPESPRSPFTSWFEIGRPQIHGYEMAAGVVPPLARVPHRLFSAGDEKVIRVFDAPWQFLRALICVSGPRGSRLCDVELRASGVVAGTADAISSSTSIAAAAAYNTVSDSVRSSRIGSVPRADFAFVAELGLTNHGVSGLDGLTAADATAMRLDGRDAGQEEEGDDARAVAATTATALPLLQKQQRDNDDGGGGDTTATATEGSKESSTAILAKADTTDSATAGSKSGHGGGINPSAAQQLLLQRVSTATSPPAIDFTPTVSISPCASSPTIGASETTTCPCNDIPSSTLALPRDAHSNNYSSLTLPPPLESDIVRNTRWPEVDKLYAHHNEVVALAASSDGAWVASASKARDEAAALVRIWDGRTHRLVQTLQPAHKLTVVGIAFSPAAETCRRVHCARRAGSASSVSECEAWAQCVVDDDDDGDALATAAHSPPPIAPIEYLLTVSKDRSVAMYARTQQSSSEHPSPPSADSNFNLLSVVRGAHKRIIWSVGWAPYTASAPRVFATGARDQVVKLWTVDTAAAAAAMVPPPSLSTTATTTPSSGVRASSSTSSAAPALSAADAVTPSASPPSSLVTAHSPIPAFPSAVTSVSFAPLLCVTRASATDRCSGGGTATSSKTSVGNSDGGAVYLWWLAVGLENGAVSLWRVSLSTSVHSGTSSSSGAAASPWSVVAISAWDDRLMHADTVRGIAWRPLLPSFALDCGHDTLDSDCGRGGRAPGEVAGGACFACSRKEVGRADVVQRRFGSLQVATCSADGSVRVFALRLPVYR